MAAQPLAITACDLITPLDDAAGTTWDALCAGRRVTDQPAINDRLLDADTQLDRSIRLALTVAKRTLRGRADRDIALFCGTSKGPAETMLKACAQVRLGKPLDPCTARQVALGAGAMGTLLRERLELTDSVHTSVAACASGLHALHRAAAAIGRRECQRALVIAADASLNLLFEASFDRLGVLAPKDAAGIRRCAPFSDCGQGFFPAEAAAALLLEPAEQSLDNSGQPPLAWLENSWIGGDSTGLIAVDPQTRSLRAGLATLSPDPPAFVHAHATGTAHDRYELAAIHDRFGKNVPIFSHKKYVGHSLGAAGLVSVVLSTLCHAHQKTFTGTPIPRAAPSITLAQGFGGHIGIVALRARF